MFACHLLVLPLVIFGKIEDARIPYAFTSASHFFIRVLFNCLTKVLVWIVLYAYFCYSVGMTSGILSESCLVNILPVFITAR